MNQIGLLSLTSTALEYSQLFLFTGKKPVGSIQETYLQFSKHQVKSRK